MKTRLRRFFVLAMSLVLSVSLAAPVVSAEKPEIDDRFLIQLYEAFLRKEQKDTYLEKRIADERARIRSLIDDELNALVNPEPAEEQVPDLLGAIERQRSVVNALEDSLRERKVDLELLLEEEKKYYLGAPLPPEEEEYRLTTSHGELLAKKAVLEERIAALEFFLAPQRERLQKLTWEQRLAQFSLAIGIGKYVGLLLLIVFFERIVRTKLLTRIQNRERRYTTMKMFTGTVYLIVIVWLLARLLTEYPRILTSLAIVGAGLAVALQDVVKDIIGWLTIVQGRRFSPGQRIAVGPYTGDVIDIGLLRTTLLEVGTVGASDLERSGKTLYVPNSLVLTQSVLNYNTTSDFIKAELPITVTYDSNWKRAEEILLEILHEETDEYAERARRQAASRTQEFYFSHELRDPIVYVDLAPHGVHFMLRFYVPVGERRLVIYRVTQKVLARFANESPPIELAYPTSRVYATTVGGESGVFSEPPAGLS
jgi:small-conductance mechanosensitive channel